MSVINREPSQDARLDALCDAQLEIQRRVPIADSKARAWVGYLLLAGRLFNPAVETGVPRWRA